MSSDYARGLKYVLATALVSGFSIFANKYFVGSFTDPYVFTTAKNASVAVLLVSILALTKDAGSLRTIPKRGWLKLAAIGLIGGSIPFLLFYKGLTLTSAANGSLIHKTMFLYVGILAAVFLKERMNAKLMAAAGIILAGNLVAISMNAYSANFGDLLILAATGLWAAETIISKNALTGIKPSIVASARMLFGSAVLLAFLAATGRMEPLYAITAAQATTIAASSLLLLLYVHSWYNGLKHLPASTAAAVLLLGAPVTTILSLASHSPVPTAELAGGILIAAGVAAYIKLSATEAQISVA
jgi:drug/metabolite transporter (DMT)-like permease